MFMKGGTVTPLVKTHRRYSQAAEEGVLGRLLLDWQKAWPKVAGRLQPHHFHRPDHRVILAAMFALAAQNVVVDIITLGDHLERFDQLKEVGGLAYLGTLARDTPTPDNIGSYADIILERAKIRGSG
jgi:replicative DNA helicase